MDLGISSSQIDNPTRGFSFMHQADLDMRMDQNQKVSAFDIVNSWDAIELSKIFKSYGEEKFAWRIANQIIEHRNEKGPIKNTLELANIAAKAQPKKDLGKNPATRIFQALRIQTNEELQELEIALPKALELLKIGGRLVIISFHSLEDRIVKNFITLQTKTDFLPKNIPIKAKDIKPAKIKKVGKFIKPSPNELAQNPRSRSATLRVIEKVSEQ